MKSSFTSSLIIIVLSGIFAMVVDCLDVLGPGGGFLYCLPVLFTYLFSKEKWIPLSAGFGTVLALSGILVFLGERPLGTLLIDRLVILFAISVVTFLARLSLRDRRACQRSSSDLENFKQHMTQESSEQINELKLQNEHLKGTLKKNQENESKLRTSEMMYRGMAQSSPAGIFQLDTNECITFVNPAWERISGKSNVQALGLRLHEVFYKEDQPRILLKWLEAEKENHEFSGEYRIEKANGDITWVWLEGKFLYDDIGKVTLGILTDITEIKRQQKQKEEMVEELLTLKKTLEKTVRTDTLTGLMNRRGIQEQLESERNRAIRYKREFCILLCDLDLFKSINDAYGHDMGDFVLIEASNRFKHVSRSSDVVCRWGGEEFMILLPETDLEGAIVAAEKLRHALEAAPFVFGGHSLQVTASFGISVCGPEMESMEQCIKQADEALYRAKDRGRNQVAGPESDASNDVISISDIKSRKKS